MREQCAFPHEVDTCLSFAYQILLVGRIVSRAGETRCPIQRRLIPAFPAWNSVIDRISKGIHLDFWLDTPSAPA
jgi:hypothetical protein